MRRQAMPEMAAEKIQINKVFSEMISFLRNDMSISV
jgi:hypothetical protein